jgi:hypothetical protein
MAERHRLAPFSVLEPHVIANCDEPALLRLQRRPAMDGESVADLLAQQEADAEQKQRDQREANRTRLRPSSVEIARRRCETNAPGCI